MMNDLVNRILDANILRPPPAARDAWSLGTASGTTAAGVTPVIIDGDTVASNCKGANAEDGDRVLVCLLGRARLLVENLTAPAGGSMSAAAILAALLTVDGAGSGLDADLLDGNSSAAFLLASAYTAADVKAKMLTQDGAGSTLDADLLDGSHASAFAPASGILKTALAAAVQTSLDKADAALPASSYTAADVLAKMLTVDGASSGLDADKLDGVEAAALAAYTAGAAWSPSYSCNGSMTISSINTTKANHWHIGELVFIDLVFDCTLGGTASNGVRFTLPHAVVTSEWVSMQGDYFVTNHYGVNAALVGGTNNTMQILRIDSTTTYVTGTGRQFAIKGWYKPA